MATVWIKESYKRVITKRVSSTVPAGSFFCMTLRLVATAGQGSLSCRA